MCNHCVKGAKMFPLPDSRVRSFSLMPNAGEETRRVQYVGAGLWELELAWATTVHKAQGSEARAVVLALAPSHRPLLTRRLLYTGAAPDLLT